jgi:hypothetical protein
VLQRFGMGLRPEKPISHSFQVDDVTDQIQLIAPVITQEIEKEFDAAGSGAQMDVG